MNIKTALTAGKTVVTSKAGRSLLKLQKHSPVILLVGGTAGAITSTVLACKATLRLDEVMAVHNEKLAAIAEARDDESFASYTEKDYRRDAVRLNVRKAVAGTRLYALAIGVGAISYAALGGSHVILSRRHAGVAAAYALVDQSYKDYRARVVERYGVEADQELRYESELREVVTDTENGPKVEEVRTFNKDHQPSQYAEIFGPKCPPWQPRGDFNMVFLRGQQTYHNNMLRARGHVFLNEVLDDLGLPRTKAGAQVGWVKGEGFENFISFGLDDPENWGDNVFRQGRDGEILLDFNVDGVILDHI